MYVYDHNLFIFAGTKPQCRKSFNEYPNKIKSESKINLSSKTHVKHN